MAKNDTSARASALERRENVQRPPPLSVSMLQIKSIQLKMYSFTCAVLKHLYLLKVVFSIDFRRPENNYSKNSNATING